MNPADIQFRIGHRTRLRQKFMDGKLNEAEMLELLLTFAIPRRDVRPLARQLIAEFGNVYHVLHAGTDALLAIPGIGQSTVLLLNLVHDLISVNYKKQLECKSVYLAQDALIAYCRDKMTALATEEFHVLYLDANLCMAEHEVHSRGSIEATNVYFDRIVARAINKGYKSVLLLHNHPTTDNTFSMADIDVTQKLEYALNLCGIQLFDHLVVSGGIVHSMRAECMLDKKLFKS